MAPGDDQTVAGDRFFAEVRRRHPDIDIVLLPQEPPREDTSEEVPGPVDDAVAASLEADLEALLPLLAPDLGTPPPQWRWGPGDRTGTVARQSLVAVESVAPVRGLTALSGAERALVGAGWHVLVPPDGIPRVLAGRADGAQVQVLYVEPRGRYAVTLRSPSYAVGPGAATDLLRGVS
jgi:hypothetical protein